MSWPSGQEGWRGGGTAAYASITIGVVAMQPSRMVLVLGIRAEAAEAAKVERVSGG